MALKKIERNLVGHSFTNSSWVMSGQLSATMSSCLNELLPGAEAPVTYNIQGASSLHNPVSINGEFDLDAQSLLRQRRRAALQPAALCKGASAETGNNRQQQVIEQCQNMCDKVSELVRSDWLGSCRKRAHCTSHEADESTSKVGLMVDDLTVYQILPCSPAALSKAFRKGDVITSIDRIPATKDNINDLLIGCDIPGSFVTITFARPQCRTLPGVFKSIEVVLRRAHTSDLIEMKKMWDFLSQFRDRISLFSLDQGNEFTHEIEQFIQTWNTAIEHQMERYENVVTTVEDKQVTCMKAVGGALYSLIRC
jgi:hypothetical protein